MTQAALATKLVAASKAIGYIAKAGRNEFHKYNYVTDADVLDKVREALQGQGIATVVDVSDVQHEFNDGGSVFTTVRGALSFIDADTGETIVTGFAGTGSDKGDKGYYKAVTGGIKYAFLKSFLIPTGDDPEVDTAEGRAPGRSNATGPTPPPADATGLTRDQVKLFMARLDDAGLKSVNQKKALTTLLVGKYSTKQMTSADLDTVLKAIEDNHVAVANALAVA